MAMARKAAILALLVSFFGTTLAQPAFAAIIHTQTLLAEHGAKGGGQDYALESGREAAATRLIAMGVDPKEARARVAALTEGELAVLDYHLNKLPAGAGALEVVGLVFVVFLILELTGVTNIFTSF